MHSATVFGAYGHTGRFVVAELSRRGWKPVLAGRDERRLTTLARASAGAEVRVASVDDPASLDSAVTESRVVINCAGPFLDTAVPLVEAALRAKVHYLDIAAEQAAVLDVFERFSPDRRARDVVVVPAMAFFGGLSDLMATAAMDDWDSADEIDVAVALDSWQPTHGTRLTGQRNPGQRFVFANHTLARGDLGPRRQWTFPEPVGAQEVAPIALAEAITISRHLRTCDIRAYMNLAPLTDLRNPHTPAPLPADESGRSSQTFLVETVARKGRSERRVVVSGQDIYASTAPLVVEAAERIVSGASARYGVAAAGELFNARDFLCSLTGSTFAVQFG